MRSFHDPMPDYSRKQLEIPKEKQACMFARLQLLFGEETAKKYLPEIERVLKVHHAHKPPALVEEEKDFKPEERFTERDLVMITYGDLVVGDGASPLLTLNKLLGRPGLRGIFNTIHILPFFPYSSDRGFSVKNFKQVDPELGSWHDIMEIGRNYQLMFDGVINHFSAQSWQFQEVLNGHPFWKSLVISYRSPDELPEEHKRLIRRPRTSDILTKFDSIDGPIWVWTTFSPDQVDLNYQNPDVLLQTINTLLLYARKGANVLRLDAVTYMWAELGTTCASLEETHEIIKLFRDIVEIAEPRLALLTETNVPHEENISYFGNGHDEAHMVYNFALPPLVLHTFYTADATKLSDWATDLEYPSRTTTYLNILDTHDGIGILGVKDILSADHVGNIIQRAKEHGALISYRSTGDGPDLPYEINSTWWGALNREGNGETLRRQVRRFIASKTIPLVLKGVPGAYFHGVIGTGNDSSAIGPEGSKRDINRQSVNLDSLLESLEDPGSKLAMIRSEMYEIAEIRVREPAFHPQGGQRILSLLPEVFSVIRTSPTGDRCILCLLNVSDRACECGVPLDALDGWGTAWTNLLNGEGLTSQNGRLTVPLQPYEVAWLEPEGQPDVRLGEA